MNSKSPDWLDHEDTLRLKKEMEDQLSKAIVRLRGVAGMSSDPKCTELARECRKIEEFIKELSGDKNAKRNAD